VRTAGRRHVWRNLRILILLTALLLVAVTTWQQRYLATRWRTPLFVAIYPVALDRSPATARYVATLEARDFAPIDGFFAREAARYRVPVGEPFRTRLRPELHESPPQRSVDAGVFATIIWSLELRYWVWRVSCCIAIPRCRRGCLIRWVSKKDSSASCMPSRTRQ